METILESNKGLHASEALRSNFSDRSSIDSLEGFTDFASVRAGHTHHGVHRGMKVVTLGTQLPGREPIFEGGISGLHLYANVFSGFLHPIQASALEVYGALSAVVFDDLRASHLVIQESSPAGAVGTPKPRIWKPSIKERPTATQALVERITAYKHFKTDWDEDGESFVSDAVVNAAVAIVDAISIEVIRLPQPTLSTDGEIGLSWFHGHDLFELTIDADLHIVWVVQRGKKVVPGEVHPVDSGGFPGMVTEAVREFYARAAKSAVLSG